MCHCGKDLDRRSPCSSGDSHICSSQEKVVKSRQKIASTEGVKGMAWSEEERRVKRGVIQHMRKANKRLSLFSRRFCQWGVDFHPQGMFQRWKKVNSCHVNSPNIMKWKQYSAHHNPGQSWSLSTFRGIAGLWKWENVSLAEGRGFYFLNKNRKKIHNKRDLSIFCYIFGWQSTKTNYEWKYPKESSSFLSWLKMSKSSDVQMKFCLWWHK